MDTSSPIADNISRLSALQLLIGMGYRLLTPEDALEARGNRSSNVLLEMILRKQLKKINSLKHKSKENSNIDAAVRALKNLPLQNGFMAANVAFYQLLTVGKSPEQNPPDDKKGLSLQFIDWESPDNNIYHVTENFSVLRSGRTDHYHPDLVLFVNGIPVVVIECKSPSIKHPAEQGIQQHLRNQNEGGISRLYCYSNLLISLAMNEAKYATTASPKDLWCVWKEQFRNADEEKEYHRALRQMKGVSIPLTAQDELLYNLCRKDRLLELMYHFILFDEGVKKISRYYQYFAVKRTLEQITYMQPDGRRQGGIIWQTQGSGKSFTMLILARMIAIHPQIRNTKIVLLTDHAELNDQFKEIFKRCNKPLMRAATGKKLLELLHANTNVIVITSIGKFQSAVNTAERPFNSPEVFVLVDELKNTRFFTIKMQRVFPRACCLVFTGTPLLQKDKVAAAKFGGIIPGTVYNISNAIQDQVLVPLFYETRYRTMEADDIPADNFLSKVAEPMMEYSKTAHGKQLPSRNAVVQSLFYIETAARNIVEHFTNHIQGTPFKGQLVTPNNTAAICYYEAINRMGKISVGLLISEPDDKEEHDDVSGRSQERVKQFYKQMMDKYGNKEQYEKTVINNFQKHDRPEIIIVVDKLLAGFHSPRNQVLYLTGNLRQYILLQTMARVNRFHEGKAYGYIIDYCGNLENPERTPLTHSGLEYFDAGDLAETFIDVKDVVARLSMMHSELLDAFKDTRNKYDESYCTESLTEKNKRDVFYERISAYAHILDLALCNADFIANTPQKQIEKYIKDATFFLALAVFISRRYLDDVDDGTFKLHIQRLAKTTVATGNVAPRFTKPSNIFNKAQLVEEPEEVFRKGKNLKVPKKLKHDAVAVAFFHLAAESLEKTLMEKLNSVDIAGELASGIGKIVKQNVLDDGQPIIDWHKNDSVKGRISIGIDDLMYELINLHHLPISFEQVDQLIESCIELAEAKYRNQER